MEFFFLDSVCYVAGDKKKMNYATATQAIYVKYATSISKPKKIIQTVYIFI